MHCFGQFSVLQEAWLDGVDEYPGEIGISNQCVVDTLSYQSCDRWGQLIHQYLPFEDLDTQSRSLTEIQTENRLYWLHPWGLPLGSRSLLFFFFR